MFARSYDGTANVDDSRYFGEMALALVALILLVVPPLTFLSEEMKGFYVDEGGPIQVFSAAGYLVVVATLIREMSYTDLLKHWYFIVIPIAMCLRELDFHVHLTTYSITKTTLYVSPDVPVWEKLLGVLVFVGLGITAFALLRQHFGSFMRGLRHGDAAAVAIAAAIGCALLSKGIDGAQSNLAFLGIHITNSYASVVIEEILELGIPIYMAIAAFAAFPAQDREQRGV